MPDTELKKFKFGLNWQAYSKKTLNEGQLERAKQSLRKLFGASGVAGKSFLDIGCGSGLFSIAARQLGACEVQAVDIDDLSVKTSEINQSRFHIDRIEVLKGDILDEQSRLTLRPADLVYAWGSLHHTGQLWKAIECTVSKVKPEGYLMLAIYRRDSTSPIWRIIKKVYNTTPALIQKIMILFFYPVIFMAKWITTGKNPLNKERGMNFYYDVVDWIGGYPYEYASKDEVLQFVEPLGFTLQGFYASETPTGCHEYVFKKIA